MDRTPHRIVNPMSLPEPVGFSHALLAAPGRTVHVGGQLPLRPSGSVVGETVVQQFDQALANMVEALRSAGAEPGHVVDMCVYTTSMTAYRANLPTLGSVYRRHMGRYYPPMSVVGVTELLEADALVELVCTAVVPEDVDEVLEEDAEALGMVEAVEETLVAQPPAERVPERSRA
ncbi:RidA family protein [Nocardiopsis sp. LOL_012]|uniref:RidA family protein n=1 Tax=Nocardiopsis sp. LOL_012 TaxID=3345409 RepID=UPI003A86C075